MLIGMGINIGSNAPSTPPVGPALITARLPASVSTINFIGDSITFGVGASDNAHRWTTLVSTALGATETNNGISGTVLQNSRDASGAPRASNGRDRYKAAMTGANKKAMAVIAYGFNDARYTGAPDTLNSEWFYQDYHDMIIGLLEAGYDNSDIVIVSPYYISDTGLITGSTGFTGQTREQFSEFITVAQGFAEDFGLFYVNMYDYMANHGAEALIGPDFIHPTDAGHAIIAQGVLAATRVYRPSVNIDIATSPTIGQIDLTYSTDTGGIVWDGVSYSITIFPVGNTLSIAGYDETHGYFETDNSLTSTDLRPGVYSAVLNPNYRGGSGYYTLVTGITVAAEANIFMADYFTSDNGIAITAHTGELGATWSLQTGNTPATPATIQDNMVWASASSDVYKTSATPPSADYWVEGHFVISGNIVATDNVGVTGRASTSANTYYVARYSHSATAYQLLKVVAGAATVLGTDYVQAFDANDAQDHRIRLTMTGSTIKLTLDDTDRITVTDTAITAAGKAGVRLAVVQTAYTGIQLDWIRAGT